MTKKSALLTLILPALAVLALLFWSLGLPLLACMAERSSSLKEYWEYIVFAHVCVLMFGIPACAWIPVSIATFGVGAWLLLSVQSESRSKICIAVGIGLSVMPIMLLSLAPFFGEYRGP